ncbi:MAG: MBL fold metallo-hydrolase [Myxococcota bacterium]|nr:MBL fold metallo-hydrolase [Myxococcota bacterium]
MERSTFKQFSPELAVLPLRTPTLPPATHTNCYLLGNKRLTLVEPASPWEEEQNHLAECVLERDGTVERIVLTHHHLDHIGGVEVARSKYGCPVVAHARTAELLDGQIEIDEFLGEGDTLETDQGHWDVLHTPGHASGHLCLANRRTGDFVVGDMVAGEGTIVLDPPDGVLADYLESLERLRTECPKVLHPAHGDAILDADGLLRQYIEHRHMRTQQVRAALGGQGRAQPIDLVPEIYPELPVAFHGVAERQVLCHLHWLEAEGYVSAQGDSWTNLEVSGGK